VFRFSSFVIEPAFEDIAAREIVEIGCWYGFHTRLLAAYCKRVGGLCHVIDPAPLVDVDAYEQDFAGHIRFHRAVSLEALKGIPSADVVLVDGDHNWYTVYHELLLIEQHVTRRDGSMPLVILHDVGHPYGRRDLYYTPEHIPEEFRQPYATKGIVLGQCELAEQGGLNPQLYNAVQEGGPRNGVLTAVEDFMAQSQQELELTLLPVNFGLAFLASRKLLNDYPALRRRLARFNEAEGLRELLAFAEALLVDVWVRVQEANRECVHLRNQLEAPQGDAVDDSRATEETQA
jgi:SAM-dependent methyltransferase